jgi:chemotaxis protein methyltransferase CheR
MKHNLTDNEFLIVCKVIASALGLHFPSDRRAVLSRGLADAAAEMGYHNMKEFLNWFAKASFTKEQIEILASHLTISETYFWREPSVFDALTQSALKELIDLKGDNKNINVWCAGCSTGEEAYSIAIALCRTIPRIKDWKVKIFATDINAKALVKARSGVYGTWSFRNTPLWLKEFYFVRTENREYEVIPEIKEMVDFSVFNLITENYNTSFCKNNRMDLIFCRNVIMYFTDELTSEVSGRLFESLNPEGWLVVSACELSSELFHQFIPVNYPGSVLYRKSNNSVYTQSPVSSNNQLLNSAFQPVIGTGINVNQVPSSENYLASMIENDFILPELSTQDEEILPAINALPVNHKEIADLISENKTSIKLLADKGKLDEALAVCNDAIAANKLTAQLYYLKAEILQEQNRPNEAIQSLKQVIYIDPDHLLGYYTLGNIFMRRGAVKRGLHYFKNALLLLNSMSGEEILSGSDGLTVNYIKGIILSTLQVEKLS